MEYHIILLIIIIFLAYYYYNIMENYVNTPDSDQTHDTIKTKVPLSTDQRECSREEINKAEYNYFIIFTICMIN